MVVMFDSKTGKVTQRGDHNGTPRIWTVTVTLEGFPEKLTFRSPTKVQIKALSKLIHRYLDAVALEHSKPLARIQWTAIAR